MLFGTQSRFGIEVGEIAKYPGWILCQFRFWVNGLSVGDWEDRIPLLASVRYMRDFCQFSAHRIHPEFESMTSAEVFAEVYDAFYEFDYTLNKPEIPDLRDRFHMDDIGMTAVIDRYGIVLVAVSDKKARLLVRDRADGGIYNECTLEFGEVERVGMAYVAWGEKVLSEAPDS